jgi:DNA recombination protein RmuC
LIAVDALQHWITNTPYWFTACLFVLGALLGAIAGVSIKAVYARKSAQKQTAQALSDEQLRMQALLENQQITARHEYKLLQQENQQLQSALQKEKDEKSVLNTQAMRNQQRLQTSLSEQERQIGELSQEAKYLQELKQNYQDLHAKLNASHAQYSQLKADHESQKAAFAQERIAFDEKLTLLKQAEQSLYTQFENLANKIFEQKAEKFSKTSEQGIQHLLNPLKQQLEDFKRQISNQYVEEGKDRAALKSEILGLKELNLQITQEAAALTNALKGDNKQQGNWGEVVLSRILDESGLREGHEYEIQKQLNNQEGTRYRPDVVVHLPNNKDIIIDSKVSLLAHEKVVNAADELTRKTAIKEHVNSLKGHIKGLSKKDYQDLAGVQSLDYVLMFVPIESAFLNAIEESPELIKLAMDNQIMLVSPTNLLVALRTINNIWQYEYQNQHAKTIADKAKRMYDKFAGFINDMEKIGKNVDALTNSYESAMSKLFRGKGNLVRQAESFKELGVTPTKSIDNQWLEQEDKQDT